jgi:hypothetical protein
MPADAPEPESVELAEGAPSDEAIAPA